MTSPLAGTLVVDCTRMLPGAVLARNLIDLGARLIFGKRAHDLLHARGATFIGDVLAGRIEHRVHVHTADRIVGEIAQSPLEDLALLSADHRWIV